MADQAGGVGALLGDAGACPEIKWNGRAWKIGHPTQDAKTALEELVVSKAVAEVTALEGVLPPAAYAKLFDRLQDRIETGHYRTFGAGWVKQTTSPAGSVYFLLALLREKQPDATEGDAAGLAAAKGGEVQLALSRVVPGFFDVLLASASHLKPEQKDAIRAALAAVVAEAFPPPPPPTPSDSPPTGSS